MHAGVMLEWCHGSMEERRQKNESDSGSNGQGTGAQNPSGDYGKSEEGGIAGMEASERDKGGD